MSTPQIPDALRGPWRAVLADDHGYLVDPDDIDEYDEVEVTVVRDTGLPRDAGDDDDDPRLPGSYNPTDVLYQHADLIPGDDDVDARWAQAQAVAAALNALPGQPSEEAPA